MAILKNRGIGYDVLPASDLQYLFLTGRLSNGENLVGATRDSGSGTRNGTMNSLCMDPSWARGDNYGSKNGDKDKTNLGPDHRATNSGGSSIMENAVQNRRLAVGYTGLAGSKRAYADAETGYYDLLGVIFDIRGGTQPVPADPGDERSGSTPSWTTAIRTWVGRLADRRRSPVAAIRRKPIPIRLPTWRTRMRPTI
jgi:hypothetical protein